MMFFSRNKYMYIQLMFYFYYFAGAPWTVPQSSHSVWGTFLLHVYLYQHYLCRNYGEGGDSWENNEWEKYKCRWVDFCCNECTCVNVGQFFIIFCTFTICSIIALEILNFELNLSMHNYLKEYIYNMCLTFQKQLSRESYPDKTHLLMMWGKKLREGTQK